MNKNHKQKSLYLLIILFSVSLCLNTQIMHLGTLPSREKMIVGEPLDLGFASSHKYLQALQVEIVSETIFSKKQFNLAEAAPVITNPGELETSLKLFGIIPLRQVTVDVLPKIKVYPGGQSIGIMTQANGVVVVGLSEINNSGGKSYQPAAKAGLKIGDMLVKMNGQTIHSESQVREIIDGCGSSGQAVSLDVKRDNNYLHLKIKPQFCQDTNSFRLGIYVRDSAVGVGTLTFFETQTNSYGALGHVITDGETNQKLNLSDGKITAASIEDVHPGKQGMPGEKIGFLQKNSSIEGTINKNSIYGIFGHNKGSISNDFFHDPVPVAMANQVKEGPAEIYTVLKGDKIEKFDISIEKVLLQGKPEGKGLIIKITDKKLLQKTGGIIQGMSGSPIVQKNDQGEKVLVGAVTHVFINDPTRGYGVLAEWMLDESNILPTLNENSNKKAKTSYRSIYYEKIAA